MNIHKIISTLLHPILMPTLVTILYFTLIPLDIFRVSKFELLGFVFSATYIFPLILLFFLKKIGGIKDFRLNTVKERRIPLITMVGIFYVLGSFFGEIYFTKSLSVFFYGITLGLVSIYISNYFKLKSSIHLMSMGGLVGFFMILHSNYGLNIAILIAVLFLLSGILASSRLSLKAHNTVEVYLGFSIGVLSQFFIQYLVY